MPTIDRQNDARRFQLLQMLDLLNARPDPAFDRLTRIAASATGTPIALLTFVGPDRQWIPARVGWEAESTTLLEAFCVYALERPALLEVPDAALDERFRDNPLVTGAHAIRFYAGHPVVFDGIVLGTVCVLDRRPRRLTDAERKVLADLAGVAGDLLERRHRQALLREQERCARDSEQYLRTVIETEPECVKLVAADGALLEMNAAGLRMIEADALAQVQGRSIYGLVAEEDRAAFRELTRRVFRGESGTLEFRVVGLKGGRRWLETHASPLRDAAGAVTALVGITRDVTERKLALQALQETEARLRLALEAGHIGIWDWDMVTGKIVWSELHEQLWGMAPGTFHGTYEEFEARLHPEDRDGLKRAVAQALAERCSYRHEFRVVRPDGTVHWIVGRGEPFFDAAGEPIRMIGTVTDITERKLAEEKVQRLNRVYAMLSGINALIVRAHDRDELFQEACRLAVEAGRFQIAWIGVVDRAERRVRPVAWSGAERGLLRAIESHLSLHPDRDGPYAPAVRAVRNRAPVVINDVANDPEMVLPEESLNRGIRALMVLPLIVGGEVAGVMSLSAPEAGFFDDTEIRLLTELAGDIAFALDHIDKAERLNYLAYYDSLTGLANRTLFHERLSQFIHTAERERLALCIMDLDHFKTINDALGRHTGDLLLVELARRLTRHFGDATQIARLGADRFAMVLPGIKNEREVAHALTDRLAQCTGEPFVLNQEELRIAAKLGIALYPNDGTDADTLFRNSEAALKKAKTSGDRFLFYTEQMTDRVGEKLSLENRLRRALEKSEFLLHYQPKVAAESRRIVGVEALIRWRDADGGLVLPMNFIPLMEETGIIVEVGAWVLRQAVQDYNYWRTAGLAAPPIAVNVSAVQLRQRDFLDIVRGAVTGVPRPPLELEITESVLMENIEDNIERLKGIRRLGVNIAIDDFGTGYSSLGYLARLPAQVLKIDLSFIARMLAERDVMTLVSTMISLAHSMRLQVVAEGVETKRQAEVLQQLKCDVLQGNLIGPPIGREQLAALLPRAESRRRVSTPKRRPSAPK